MERKYKKIFEFDPDTAYNIDYGIKLSPYIFCKRLERTVVAYEVEDYSIFVKEDLSDVKGVFIKSEKSRIYETRNIIASSVGSILYFEEPIKGIFKNGCIYPIIIYKKSKFGIDWRKSIEAL